MQLWNTTLILLNVILNNEYVVWNEKKYKKEKVLQKFLLSWLCFNCIQLLQFAFASFILKVWLLSLEEILNLEGSTKKGNQLTTKMIMMVVLVKLKVCSFLLSFAVACWIFFHSFYSILLYFVFNTKSVIYVYINNVLVFKLKKKKNNHLNLPISMSSNKLLIYFS